MNAILAVVPPWPILDGAGCFTGSGGVKATLRIVHKKGLPQGWGGPQTIFYFWGEIWLQSVWAGYLTFGLISMPVRLFSGARGTKVSFHLPPSGRTIRG